MTSSWYGAWQKKSKCCNYVSWNKSSRYFFTILVLIRNDFNNVNQIIVENDTDGISIFMLPKIFGHVMGKHWPWAHSCYRAWVVWPLMACLCVGPRGWWSEGGGCAVHHSMDTPRSTTESGHVELHCLITEKLFEIENKKTRDMVLDFSITLKFVRRLGSTRR